MHCLDLLDPIPLSREALAAQSGLPVPAVALLGSLDCHGSFVPVRLVRSDSNMLTFLENLVGAYPYCKIYLCKTPGQAYVLECELFHHLRPVGMNHHPVRPAGLNVVCPFCGSNPQPEMTS